MQFFGVLSLLCLQILSSAAAQAVSKTATVSGKILWPEDTVTAGDVRLLLTLDGGEQVYAWPKASGVFAFHEVPAGSHLLDILAVGGVYPEYRLDVLQHQHPEEALEEELFTVRMADNPKHVMPLPLILKPVAKAEYFEKRQPFSFWNMAKSPYGLMIGFGIFAVFILPKMKIDPEEESAGAAGEASEQVAEGPSTVRLVSGGQPQRLGSRGSSRKRD